MNIKDIFNNMEYGKAPESPDQALAWLASHKNKMSHFIDGSWQQGSGHFASNNPATGEELAQVAQGDDVAIGHREVGGRRQLVRVRGVAGDGDL